MGRAIKFRVWNGTKILSFGQAIDSGFTFRAFDIANKGKSPFQLMQYTGLKDRNGKELYYNDIVRIDVAPERLWMATKDDFDIPCFLDAAGAFGVMLTFEKVFLGGIDNSRDGFEIVGNIYENADLVSTQDSAEEQAPTLAERK